MALNRKSDPGRIKTETADVQRDLAAKGGPALGLSDPQNRKASPPYDELQARAATGNTGKKGKQHEDVPGEGGLDEPTRESQTHSRGSKARGSNH